MRSHEVYRQYTHLIAWKSRKEHGRGAGIRTGEGNAAMKIAYGTYAMPTIPLEEALPALAQMGYDGVEVCIGPNHVGSMPDQMDAARRERVRGLLDEHSLGVPALFLAGHIYTENSEEHRATLDHLRVCAELARDLGLREPPVLAIGLGGRSDQWDTARETLVRLLAG